MPLLRALDSDAGVRVSPVVHHPTPPPYASLRKFGIFFLPCLTQGKFIRWFLGSTHHDSLIVICIVNLPWPVPDAVTAALSSRVHVSDLASRVVARFKFTLDLYHLYLVSASTHRQKAESVPAQSHGAMSEQTPTSPRLGEGSESNLVNEQEPHQLKDGDDRAMGSPEEVEKPTLVIEQAADSGIPIEDSSKTLDAVTASAEQATVCAITSGGLQR